MRLRPLTSGDADALATLERDAQPLPWSPTKLREELEHDHAHVLGAFDDDELVAYAAYRRIADEVWLLNLAVHPRARRQGLARALLEEGVRWARAVGASSLWLEVRAGNAAARHLYASSGFLEEATRRRYYPPLDGRGPREDAILMRRPL